MLDNDHLAALSVRRAEALDIEENAIDFAPRFFAPRFTLEQAREKTTGFLADHGKMNDSSEWPKRCRRARSPSSATRPATRRTSIRYAVRRRTPSFVFEGS